MSDQAPASLPVWSSPVVYTGVRPPGGPRARVIGFIALGSFAALLTGPFLPFAWMVGLIVLVLTGPLSVVLFFARGIHEAGMVRAFEPYRELPTPTPGAHLRGRTEYSFADHLGCVLYWSPLPIVGSALFTDTKQARHWHELNELVAGKGLKLPRTIAAEALREKLSRIELTTDLLEPEAVKPARAIGKRGLIAGALFYFAGGAFMLSGSAWEVALLYTLFGAGFLLSLPGLRRATRAYRWEHDAPVVGCGVLRLSKRRWSCDDAVMVVQDTVFTGGILVTVWGQDGMWSAGFSDATDDDFVNLWQRWNHLDPKPDLLAPEP